MSPSVPALRRTVVAVAVLAIGLIHVLDLPGKWEETRWMAYGYLALVASCVMVAEWLVRSGSRLVWAAAAAIAAGPMAGFVLTRTTGLPGATDDIGNWWEPLGLASLFVEGLTVLAALAGMASAGHTRTGSARTASTGAAVPAPRVSAEFAPAPSPRRAAVR